MKLILLTLHILTSICQYIRQCWSMQSERCLQVSNDGSIHTDCSICPPGYYCPTSKPISDEEAEEDRSSYYHHHHHGHHNNTEVIITTPVPCGSPSKYCPTNSTKPSHVQKGYYTVGGKGPNTRTNQTIAPIGYFAFEGQLFKCPAGKFGDRLGLSSIECSGICHSGYYCPAGSTSQKEIPCGSYQYCPMGSSFPLYVRHGYYTTTSNQTWHHDKTEFQEIKPLTHQSKETECEIGHFCHRAVKYKCFPGTYGDRKGERDMNCTGLCEAGYYCRSGSTSPRESRCGNPSFYCPTGSKMPIPVDPGYYTVNDLKEPFDRKTKQHICPKGHWCWQGYKHQCPAGSYGKDEGLSRSTCSGYCLPGYYCGEGSTSNKQYHCGDESVHCPIGSSSPKLTEEGKYSYNSSADSDRPPFTTMSWQRDCEEGFYCVNGKRLQCPDGTFNNLTGSNTKEDCAPCDQGFYCTSKDGYPSTNSTQVRCGDVNKYCPEKSPFPITVDIGYYSVGGEEYSESNPEMYRSQQEICPKGSYCIQGRKFFCPAGTYGNKSGLYNKLCSGFCPAGFFCVEGTSEPEECPTNTYATSGNKVCTECNNVPDYVRGRCKTSRICCSR